VLVFMDRIQAFLNTEWIMSLWGNPSVPIKSLIQAPSGTMIDSCAVLLPFFKSVHTDMGGPWLHLLQSPDCLSHHYIFKWAIARYLDESHYVVFKLMQQTDY
jgi:hypothetical protein